MVITAATRPIRARPGRRHRSILDRQPRHTAQPLPARPAYQAQHFQNYLTATAVGGTRYATISAAGKKNKLKMKYPMKL
jgi:hypothetical protein